MSHHLANPSRHNPEGGIMAQVIQERDGLNNAEAETAICAFEKDVRRPGAVK
jgi:hypothetical protein